MLRRFACLVTLVLMFGGGEPASAASDIVIYASSATLHGSWVQSADGSAAGGASAASPDAGWSQTAVPLAAPADYFEVAFSAPSGTAYHVWLRLRATGDSKWNDSVWVQYSDAAAPDGSPLHRIGTPSALVVNLAADSSGAGLSGWGWANGAYWLSQQTVVQFAGSGTHTIRIQTREDGVDIDQIVLSPATYMNAAPGGSANDGTILPLSGATTIVSTTSTAAAAIPGTIEAENFDSGGPGVSYFDTTSGNSGGAYRSTDVDIEPSSEGGYDVGWIAAGEWLNYTVNVTSSDSYTVRLRMASPTGGSLHLGFGGSGSNVWTSVRIPATGGWQNWTTVNVPVALSAGPQMMTLLFDTDGLNVNSAVVSGASTPPGGGTSATLAYGGTPRVIPGAVEAEDFDTGGAGVSFGDSTAGNSGGQYRQTDVDIETASGGGYDVGWIAASEYLNYTVNVSSSGSYTARLRVASPSGGSLHLGFGGPSDVWTSVSIPSTGGWQNWTYVSVPVTVTAGAQLMTVRFDTAGLNIDNVAFSSGPTPTSGGSGGTSGGSTDVPVLTWNIQVDDNTEAHARLAMDLALASAPRPAVITIQEAYLEHFDAYLDELQRQTGQVWHGVFATHCGPGQWTGSSCASTWWQGVGIFTTYTIVNSDHIYFPYADCWSSARAALRAALDVNGAVLQVFTAHLTTGTCSDVVTARQNSIDSLKRWAAGYSSPQIVSGDFNDVPAVTTSSTNMGAAFTDVWPGLGSGNGLTAYLPDPQYRIDYWFIDQSGAVSATSVEVDQNTSMTSDHLPVRAGMRVR